VGAPKQSFFLQTAKMPKKRASDTQPQQQLNSNTHARGVLKGHLTRFQNCLQRIRQNEISIEQLKPRLINMEKFYIEFNQIQTDIEFIDGSDVQLAERDDFENKYYELLADAEELMKHVQNDIPSDTSLTNNVTTDNGTRVRLPTISLPTFGGEYEQWLLFKDSFASLIDNNSNLTDIQKFQYLRSSLSGDALQVVHSLETSSDNYKIAWKLLNERYENIKIITHVHIKGLVELPTVVKDSYSSLRQFIDAINRNMRALQALKQPVEHWDTILLYLITNKLDFVAKRDWELLMGNKAHDILPTMQELLNFLSSRCHTLSMIEKTRHTNQVEVKQQRNQRNVQAHVSTNTCCSFCKGNHQLYTCENFIKMQVLDRIDHVKNSKLCYNCLKGSHMTPRCKAGSCRKCNRRHNTLLHVDAAKQFDSEPQTNTLAHSSQLSNNTIVLLSTAVVYVKTTTGEQREIRALLDSGAQSNFITQDMCKLLGLKTENINTPVTGISGKQTVITQQAITTIHSRLNPFRATLTFLVIPKITEHIPMGTINKADITIPTNIQLADPTFMQSSKIDMLIGAEIFLDLLCIGQIKTSKNAPIYQKTRLGWIISGKISNLHDGSQQALCHVAIKSLDAQLERFWTIEETTNPTKFFTQEEIRCEEIFKTTTIRNKDGVYTVRLPFKEDKTNIGDSRELALKRFYNLERKFERQPQLRETYASFLREYETLGHMAEVTENITCDTSYYLPHHAVLKPSSTTTKLRVVFDASAKSGGKSLNDILLVGPTIQPDLFTIIMRYRTHQIVVTADIEKMYRQIRVHDDDTSMQQIFWRESSQDPIKTFKLRTVTYGTSCAPFLAVRCLQQIAEDEGTTYPIAKQVILDDFYVDDLLTGGQTKEQVLTIQYQVDQALKSAGVNLRKWCSNEPDILKQIGANTELDVIDIGREECIKTLGLRWNPRLDSFQYSVNVDISKKRITKRSILSTIASIYDPLGLIGPVIVVAKLIMQRLWQGKLHWDETVPTSLHTSWEQFCGDIININDTRIPRKVIQTPNPVKIQLHGFADASETAYGACIYVRTTDEYDIHHVKLLCSKSRVAPLKQISVPRLELCGTLLLAQLMHKIKTIFKLPINDFYCWTDSTIALAWINGNCKEWTTFVANRVSQIQNQTAEMKWRHVRTHDNPADHISRGLTVTRLKEADNWWYGPTWLTKAEEQWPIDNDTNKVDDNTLERRKCINVCTTIDTSYFERYSSYNKLIRVTAYILRFQFNTRNKLTRQTGPLTVKELDSSMSTLVKIVQLEFANDIKHLQQNNVVNSKSKLLNLNPFLDEQQLLRVGGRLQRANLPYFQKHPIVLPSKHHFTYLLIDHHHKWNMHAGPQAVLASIRTNFWIISGRNAVRKITRRCITCFKANPTPAQQLMGNLPRERLQPNTPFCISGVDYGGPMFIKENHRKGKIKTYKCYIAVFVCFTTKAVHIELVSDLTTEAFIAALKRFISRRGCCQFIYSDNATTFVGGQRELQHIYELISSKETETVIQNLLTKNHITWKFIPPRSPHFGGLWESAVRSIKYHIKRVIGAQILTFEEYYTILTQIEYCLNSRPLIPMSNDPNDLLTLTPNHFLLGDTHLILEPNLLNIKTNYLSRWQNLVKLRQDIWKRWSREYLTQLQQRPKWKNQQANVKEGDMVLLIDEQSPLHWNMGRIVQLHPGADGLVRVVSVKTLRGTVKRAITKLCVFPSNYS
jgi:hypothetical protein